MSYIGHLENIVSQKYTVLPNLDSFHYRRSKKSHVNTPWSHQEVFKRFEKGWEATELTVADTNFPKFKFRVKAWILLLATHNISCFPWRDRFTLFISEKIFAQSWCWIARLSARVPVTWEMGFCEKTQLVQVVTQAVTPLLFLETSWFDKPCKNFYATPQFATHDF